MEKKGRRKKKGREDGGERPDRRKNWRADISDAADEEDRGEPGGRRSIQKTKREKEEARERNEQKK